MKTHLIAAALAASMSASALAQCELQVIENPHAEWQYFGSGLALDGDRALIGAAGTDGGASNAGMVHVYEPVGGTWVEVASFAASDPSTNAFFGSPVALEGDRALIAATNGSNVGYDAGAAYVFEWDGASWVERAKLEPASLGGGDFFGWALALEGARALIAAPSDDDLGGGAGAVYEFELIDGSWVETQKLTPPPGIGVKGFGGALALDGDRLLVGASLSNQPSAGTGAAFVFERRASGWELAARLNGSNLHEDSSFGRSVALEGDRAVVASLKWTAPKWRGRIHTFERGPGGWTEVQLLYRYGPSQTDFFGNALELASDSLLVSSSDALPAGPEYRGAAYLYAWSPAGWVETAELVSADVDFAKTLARDGERVLVGRGLYDADVSVWSLPTFFEISCQCEAEAPCANVDPTSGCVNSTGEGASLGACGSPSVAQDDLTFSAHLLPDNQPALLFSGTRAAPGVPFSDGRLCASGVLRRLQTHAANAAGSASFGPGLGSAGGWSAGDERLFQVWFRDNAGPCGSGSNLSSAVRITFIP